MDVLEAMEVRHSIRRYDGRALEADVARPLEEVAEAESDASGLAMRLVCDERQAFASRLATYGMFSGVANYLVITGPKGREAEEACGYHGERLVLLATRLGLGSCWVGLTYTKRALPVAPRPGERVICLVALGYAARAGVAHKSRALTRLGQAREPWPEWFASGVRAASLAPTAMNQQRFRFTLREDTVAGELPVVEARSGVGPYTAVDLGIARLHFELGAQESSFVWA